MRVKLVTLRYAPSLGGFRTLLVVIPATPPAGDPSRRLSPERRAHGIVPVEQVLPGDAEPVSVYIESTKIRGSWGCPAFLRRASIQGPVAVN